MAKLPEGFQQDTVDGFLRHISYNIPNFTEHQLELLTEYMKEVGATCEEELHKMNEEHLGDLVGEEDARLIMRYCKKIMETTARKRSTEAANGVDGGKPFIKEQPKGASGFSSPQAPARKENHEELSSMLEIFTKVYQSEGEKNREALTKMTTTVETVTASMKETVNAVSQMMTVQLEKQDEVLEMINQQAIGMEERQKKSLNAIQKWMETTREMNNEAILKLGEKVDEAAKVSHTTNEKLVKLMQKKNKSCVIQ